MVSCLFLSLPSCKSLKRKRYLKMCSRVNQRSLDLAIRGMNLDTDAHLGLWLKLGEPGARISTPGDFSVDMGARFVLERTPFPRRSAYPLAPAGITSQFEEIPVPPGLSTSFTSADLILTTAFVRLELCNRGLEDKTLLDNLMPSFLMSLHHSFVGVFRGSWLSSFKWIGQVLRSSGAVILPGGVPAHSGWSQGFEKDDSQARLAQDIVDMREYRGSFDFAQWRISAWEVRALPTQVAVPVGHLIRILYSGHVRSNIPEPRYISEIEDLSQFLEEATGEGSDDNSEHAKLLVCPTLTHSE